MANKTHGAGISKLLLLIAAVLSDTFFFGAVVYTNRLKHVTEMETF